MPKHLTESVSGTMTAVHDFGNTSVGLKTDLIAESTAAAGVSVDQVLCKDGAVTASGGVTADVTGAVTGAVAATTLTVVTSVLPTVDDTVDLGSAAAQFKDAYIDGTVYADAIDLNGTAITATGAELNIMSGVTSTAAELNQCDGVGLIGYDSTAGRVLRASRLVIVDGTAATSIKASMASTHQGDTAGEADSLTKDNTVGDFSLSANGSSVTIDSSVFTSDCIAVVACWLIYNASAVAVTVSPTVSGGDLIITFRHATTSAVQDLTTLADTGGIQVQITYLTGA